MYVHHLISHIDILFVSRATIAAGSCNNLDADFGSWILDFASLHCTAWIQPRLNAMTWW
jgi:hypothetical protein